jgi:hypothetical protein
LITTTEEWAAPWAHQPATGVWPVDLDQSAPQEAALFFDYPAQPDTSGIPGTSDDPAGPSWPG